MYVDSYALATMASCTLAFNSASIGAGMCMLYSDMLIDHCIISHSVGAEAVMAGGSCLLLTCCNIFGNEGGDWLYELEDRLGTRGNISEDPFYCAPEYGDLKLHEDSPCAPFTPPNEKCDLIGAWPIGCGPMGMAARQSSPVALALRRIVPNPFSASTVISYEVPADAVGMQVGLTVHDPAGRLVRALARGAREPGLHAVRWDGADNHGRLLPSGTYFCRLSVGDQSQTRRVLLVR